MHGSLSWTADGRTLALITSGGPPDSGVRLLDTAAPGSSLPASSRLVVPTPTDPANWSDNYWRQAMISADGQVIIAVIQIDTQDATQRMGGISQKLVTFSAETGTLLRTLNHILARGGYQQVLA